MNCRRVVSLMSAYVDGELTGIEMLEIRRHISECEECAEEFEGVRFTKQVVCHLEAVRPRVDLAASILSSLDAVEIPHYQRYWNNTRKFIHQRLSPVAAALAVSGVALVLMSAGGMDGINTGSSESVTTIPVEAKTFGVGYMPDDVTAKQFPLSSRNQPLKVRDDVSDLTHGNLELASITMR